MSVSNWQVCWLCPFLLWSPALHELSGQNFLGTLQMKDSRGLKRTGALEPPLYLPVSLLPETCDLVQHHHFYLGIS